MQHYLAPLLVPRTVALVGASERAGSLGRTVLENLVAGQFKGEIEVVNPRHRRVLGRRAFPNLAAIGKPIDLAVIATPAAAVPGILADPRVAIGAAALMSFADAAEPAARRAWRVEVAAIAKARGIRLVGPGAFGVIRTDIGLNATFCAPAAAPGRLALVSQSGAVCTAMLDFAQPMQLGFSTVISIGGGIDVGFGEILDALVIDAATDAILLYMENVGDARRFMSALRAAARIKPVVVLKAGRWLDAASSDPAGGLPFITADAVFEAALMRAGTVRVRSYAQLFAAARILAMGKIPRGNRLAIVSNGRGPALLAADCVTGTDVALAQLTPTTVQALAALLPPEMERANPVDVRGDASPARLASAVSIALSDPATDAVLAIHVPRPIIGAIEAAQAVAAVARDAEKPVLGAWLGAINRQPVQDALEAGGVANFYTPENAVDAFGFVAAYRRNQAWLLEVPSSHTAPGPPDYAAAEAIRARASVEATTLLPVTATQQLLRAFGIALAATQVTDTLAETQAAARQVGYPVTLTLDAADAARATSGIPNGRALARAYGVLLHDAALQPLPYWTGRVLVQRSPPRATRNGCSILLATDRVFGPVIGVGPPLGRSGIGPMAALMLPPLNGRLAADLLVAAGIEPPSEDLVQLLLRVSEIACALPWVQRIWFEQIDVGAQMHIAVPRVLVAVERVPAPGYRHMAIHPYPVELEATMVASDGTTLKVRPVRPEDADLERRFIASLSDETRFFRFFYRMHELSPAMLARFTQVDYDRELALLALRPHQPDTEAIVGIARFNANPDRESAEFAVVVTDAWHGRGVGTGLMRALIAAARKQGLRKFVGTVLRANHSMLRFCRRLGFTVDDDPDDPEQLVVQLLLQ